MKFKVGDRVYHRNTREYGVITKLTRKKNYPYRFETDGGSVYDTADYYIDFSDSKEKSSQTIRMKKIKHSICLASIGHSAIFKDGIIESGCQSLSLEDAKAFVDKFNELYEEL